METVFRVDVIKRGFKCGLIVWTVGRKENVSQKGLVKNFFNPRKRKIRIIYWLRMIVVHN